MVHNIDFAVSYFYQVRYFKPYMIPLSTALWDPKWYHNFKGQEHVFIDKNGVINGLRINPLVPGDSCSSLCRGTDNCSVLNPKECDFLSKYYEQLLFINFNEFIEKLEETVTSLRNIIKIENRLIAVFLVHEAWWKDCSERVKIIEWFSKNGYDLQELAYPIKDNYN